MFITNIKAHELLDSRGNPTVEAVLTAGNIMVKAAVPSGASTGKHEAVELRDGGSRYHGLGVLKAVKNIEKVIAPALKGKDVTNQKLIDTILLRLDGTKNKSKLGANALLAVSLAVAKTGALAKKMPLYEYLASVAGTSLSIPRPFFNVLNGGKHSRTPLIFL